MKMLMHFSAKKTSDYTCKQNVLKTDTCIVLPKGIFFVADRSKYGWTLFLSPDIIYSDGNRYWT